MSFSTSQKDDLLSLVAKSLRIALDCQKKVCGRRDSNPRNRLGKPVS